MHRWIPVTLRIMRTTISLDDQLAKQVRRAVPESYMVFNLLGDDHATPSAFVVDRDGVITWKYVANPIGDRPPTSNIIDQLASLGG